MANRVFFFSQPDIIAYINEHYIPVVGDDWYQRRRKDTEGEFYTQLHKQAPHTTPDGWSRQGLYTLTPSGKLLSFTNTWKMKYFMEYLHGGVEAWNKLPAEQRKPGAIEVEPIPDSELDPDYLRKPPEGGAILKIHTRILERDEDQALKICREDGEAAWGTHAAIDHFWMTREEVASLFANGADPFPLPEKLAIRFMKHNFVDNTRGEPTRWEIDEMIEREFTCKVEAADNAGNTFYSLKGSVLLRTADGKRGYKADFYGWYGHDIDRKLTEFTLTVLGDHWGDGKYTPHSRPGKTPLGIAFHLVDGSKPEDRLPPQGIRKPERYW